MGVGFSVFTRLGGLILLPLFAGEAQAGMYVRQDAGGTLHFTNVPASSEYRLVVPESDGSSAGAVIPRRLEEIIRSASQQYQVDPHLVRAVIKVESDFQSYARSRKGAQGLMQLMPDTARLHRVRNIYDPVENIHGGVRHLRLLLDRYQGDLELSLAAYNAGAQAVERHGGVPPYQETKQYIRRVLNYHRRYVASSH